MSGPIMFNSDQDEWDEAPPEYREHYRKAVMHLTGNGPHPGVYSGPQHEPSHPMDRPNLTENDLARMRMKEQGPATEPQPPGALPAQEQLQQPLAPQGKGKHQAQPHGQTPAALGVAAVKPEEPEGNF